MPETSLSLSDVVPQLRVDLKLSEAGQGAGDQTLTVQDPVSGMSIGLRGFEMSIARMLNGKRTVDEVIQSAAQVGLPLSVDSLAGFIRKLRTLGWLVEGAQKAVPTPGSMWEPRAEWDEEVRRTFQVALKDARAERFKEAKEALDGLLAQQTDLKEANELLGWVQERMEADKSGGRLPAFTDLYAEVERGWFAEGDRQSKANAKASSSAEASSPGVARTSGGGMKKAVIAVVVLGVVGGAAVLVPLPYQARATFELVPSAVTSVSVDRSGHLARVSVTEGVWVEKGATIATYDGAGAKTQLQDFDARLAVAQKKVTAASAPNKKAAELKKKVDKLAGDEKKAEAALEKEKARAKGKKTPALTKAEKKVASAQAEFAKANKALEVASANPAKDAAEKELAAVTAQRDAARAQSEATPLVAPASGFVVGLLAKDGSEVQAGTPVCRLEDWHTLTVKLTPASGEALKAGQKVTLTVEGKSVRTTIDKLDGKLAEATLDNTRGGYKNGAKGEARIDVGGRSLLNRL